MSRFRSGEGDAPGGATRLAALRLLDAVLRRGQPLESAFGALANVERGDDRAFAVAIASETLRRLADLDALIDAATPKPIAADAKARFALRIALVQALALNVAPHAAIATVLPLVDGGPRRLVHGVFGATLRKGATLPDPPNLPPAVAERWPPAWHEAARAMLRSPPPIDLSLKRGDAAVPEGVALAPRHLRVPAGSSVPDLPGYAAGDWWVQDIAASIPARLIGPGPGASGCNRAVDLCAAPGGKTMQLAAAGWDVTAIDLDDRRLERLRENLSRTGLAARLVRANAAAWVPDTPADAVLLDAPCSATGIFRRHPDVLHRVRPRAIAELAERQAQLLAHAATMVRPGGLLVYAVCSLERAEGEEVAAGFAGDGYAVEPIRADELPAGFAPTPEGWLRVAPGTLADRGGADGFFVARWRRAA